MQYRLAPVPGLVGTSDTFRRGLVSVAVRLGIDPNWLAACISFETAHTFSPSIRSGGNPKGAVGLIQFTTIGTQGLGVTVDELSHMTADDQLFYVEKYLRSRAGGRMRNLGDVYMAIFAPAGVGQADSAVLYRAPDPRYTANKSLDPLKKGYITRADAVGNGPGPLARTAANADPILVDVPDPPVGQPAPPAGGGSPLPFWSPLPSSTSPAGSTSPTLPEIIPPEVLPMVDLQSSPDGPEPVIPPIPTPTAWSKATPVLGAAVDLAAVGGIGAAAYMKAIPWEAAIAAIVAIVAGRAPAASSGLVGALTAISKIFAKVDPAPAPKGPP
jgi:hypothetical protein